MTGRVVLVTGSTHGMGKATALRFASAGDNVVFNSAHSVEAGEKLTAETAGSRYIQADISNSDDCVRLIREVIDHFGRLDVLVNNAAVTRIIEHSDLKAASLDVWREIFEVNVFGPWNLSVLAMDHLRAARGSIINVTSIAGVRAGGSSIPYAVSKAALNHATTFLAKVVGPEVRVNAVAPGYVVTGWIANSDAITDSVSSIAPLKRPGTPDDIAEVIFDLAQMEYVTGQVLVADGGLTLAM